MSLFPHFVSHNPEVSPLFRLLDDFTTLSRSGASHGSSVRGFTPKFDVREVKDAYELHGELPGIEQKDIQIEWEDSQTLTINGRVEHRSESGERPAGFITDESSTPAIENKSTPESDKHHEYRKPSIEDESAEANKGTEVAKTAAAAPKQVQKQNASSGRYWVTERSVGAFHRSFTFPSRIDQENVKASLKNGILSIVVPKAQAQKPRRIQIE